MKYKRPTRYIREVTYRVCREGPAHQDPISNADSAAALARQLIPDDDKEHFWVACLDSQNKLKAAHAISVGTMTATLVHPREVYAHAVTERAASIILFHNHPSGDPTPSREDLALTEQLSDCGKLFQIRLHDHVIIGNGTGRYASLASRGELNRDTPPKSEACS